MSLLRRVRAEMSGAVRSMRYDLGRRPVEPPSRGPDVTSTGMNTFGGHALFDEPSSSRLAPVGAPAGEQGAARAGDRAAARTARVPRRAAAVTALGVLTVVGAAGAYLGVVNGLGSLLNEKPAAADTFPPQPAVTASFAPNSGIGGGPGKTPRAAGTVEPGTTGAAGTTLAPATPGLAQPAPIGNVSPIRTTNPTKRECACDSPPVPTPTAPASYPSSSSGPDGPGGPGGPGGSADPSDSGDPEPSETSATPSDSAEPSKSPQPRHRRRHH